MKLEFYASNEYIYRSTTQSQQRKYGIEAGVFSSKSINTGANQFLLFVHTISVLYLPIANKNTHRRRRRVIRNILHHVRCGIISRSERLCAPEPNSQSEHALAELMRPHMSILYSTHTDFPSIIYEIDYLSLALLLSISVHSS